MASDTDTDLENDQEYQYLKEVSTHKTAALQALAATALVDKTAASQSQRRPIRARNWPKRAPKKGQKKPV